MAKKPTDAQIEQYRQDGCRFPIRAFTSNEAEQYRQQPHSVASLVLIGNLGSLIVMPIVLGLVFAHVMPPVS